MANDAPLYEFEKEINGKRMLIAILSIGGAEPDVGIMASFADSYIVKDAETGEELELTDEEDDKVAEACGDFIADAQGREQEDYYRDER